MVDKDRTGPSGGMLLRETVIDLPAQQYSPSIRAVDLSHGE